MINIQTNSDLLCCTGEKMTKTIPSLASVLTPFPYHIESSAPVKEAEALMKEHNIRHLIVMEDGDIYGVLSDRELQHHGSLYGMDKNSELSVNDICTNNIIVADLHDPLDKVLDVMAEKQLGCIVALREGELAGIFTTTDACKHYARYLREQLGHDNPDIVA